MVSVAAVLSILRVGVPALYAAGAAGYLAAFVRNTGVLYRWVRPALFLGITGHALLFGALYARVGHFPAATMAEGLVFSSLALSVLYFGMEWRHREVSFGAFLWPVNCGVALLACLFLDHGSRLPAAWVSPYFVFHVTAFLLAYACFFFSFAVSVMYLLQYRAIAERRLGSFFHRLPSLHVMDRAVMRTDAVGLGFLLMGLALSYLWFERGPLPGERVDIKAGFALVTAAVYLSEHLLRKGKGWTGKRTSYLSITGFLFVLLTLAVGRHGY